MAQFMNRVLNFFGLTDDTEEEILQPVTETKIQTAGAMHAGPGEDAVVNNKKATVVSLHTQKQVKVVLCEPQSYEEAASIADHIRNRRPVIVNLHKSPFDQAVRIIDFLSGTTYALSGSMQKLGQQIFLCAPENVDIQGSISEFLASQQAGK
jgi:cell division inhibitor SepF